MEIEGGRDKAGEGLEKKSWDGYTVIAGQRKFEGVPELCMRYSHHKSTASYDTRTMLLRLGRVVKAWDLDAKDVHDNLI